VDVVGSVVGLVHVGGDGVDLFLEGEMAGIEQDDLGGWYVAAVGMRTG
jgi:hypothetical protein